LIVVVVHAKWSTAEVCGSLNFTVRGFYFSIYFVQKYNNTGNSNDARTGQLGIYHALTVAHSKRTVIKFTYTLELLKLNGLSD